MYKRKLLGKRIREIRRQRNFTQEYLAEKLKIEPCQLSKLETGKHYPSFETLVSLLETLDVTFEELTSFEHLDKELDFRNLLIEKIKVVDRSKTEVMYKFLRSLCN